MSSGSASWASAIGAAHAIPNWRLSAEEVTYVLADCGAEVVFVGAEFAVISARRSQIEPLAERGMTVSFTHLVAWAIVLAFIALHSLASSGWTEDTLHAVNRYHELLFAPLLLGLLADARHRLLFLREE